MRKLASVREIRAIKPIKGADRIEVATVDGWNCVIKKGEFQVGDQVVYCEIDAFLPIREEFEFLRKSSFRKMDDREGFRLRTIKLRGEVSQGLLLPVSIVGREVELGDDVTEELGIKKYEAPIPPSLTGEVVGPFPISMQKTDEERIQNLADRVSEFEGKTFYVTEKMDGTSFTGFYDETFRVCGRNWEYVESRGNTYWDVAIELGLPEAMESMGRRLAIQGEIVGPGVQKNRYKLKRHTLFVFNVFDLDQFGYVSKVEAKEICDELGLTQVPFIGEIEFPGSVESVLAMADGGSVVRTETEREGLVWVHGEGVDRISFKAISNAFLTNE